MYNFDNFNEFIEQLTESSVQHFNNSYDRVLEMSVCSQLAYQDEATIQYFLDNQSTFFDIEYIYADGECCGFVASDHEEVFVAIRGTSFNTPDDILLDLNIGRNNYGIHTGFHSRAEKLWPSIQILLRRHRGKKIYVTGHSMGGAVAMLVSDKTNRDPFCSNIHQTYTFGAPCVDHGRLQLTTPLFRFRNICDIVPLMLENYFLFEYYHGSSEYVIDRDKSIYEIEPASNILTKTGNMIRQYWWNLRTSLETEQYWGEYYLDEHKIETYIERLS